MAELSTMEAQEAAKNNNTAPKTPKKRKKRKIVRRIVWTLVILLVLGVAGWSTYSRLKADYTVTYDPYTAVTGSISNSLSFSGSMQLISSASYTASGSAKVREVYVAEGDAVKEGDKLVRLSTGETVQAEFDGTVSSLGVEKGDEVASGDTLVGVADFTHMQVSVRVGESNIASVYEGQPCKVAVSSAGVSFDSVIDDIDYVAYTGNNVAYYTTVVKVTVTESGKIWPGMQATVTVPLEEAENVTVLKMDALSTARDNTAYVFKETESGEMERVPVTVGVSNGNYVEIKSGVTAGETVYKIAEKEETATGLAALFSGLFSNTRVNRPSSGNNRNWNNGNMPGGNFPGGGSQNGGSQGSGSQNGGGSSRPGSGSRGN